MNLFGQYETTQVLHTDARGAVYRARRGTGQDARFVVKTCVPAPPLEPDDPDEPSWEIQHFLDGARAQQNVTRRGGRHWAPVHDLGQIDNTGYIVTDFQPRSLQVLVGSQRQVGPAELFDIVSGVVRGLVELREIAGRAHGNLKPNNILLIDGPVSTWLTDPALVHHARKEGEAGDLEALGRIIFELVMHRPPGDAESAVDGPAWQRLGSQGEGWRGLCDGLLRRQINGRLASLLLLGAALESLRPAKRAKLATRRFGAGSRRVRRVAIAVGGVVLLSGGLVGALLAIASADQQRFAQAKRQWLDPLRQAVADPAVRQRFAADPALARVLADLQSAALVDFDNPARPAAALDRVNVIRSRRALAAIDQINADISPANWKRLAWAQQVQRQYALRGWLQPATYLAGEIGAAAPGAADMPRGLDRLLTLISALESQSGLADSAWRELEESLKALDSFANESVRAFARLLRRDAADVVAMDAQGLHGLVPQLEQAKNRAILLAAATRRAAAGEVDLTRLGAELAPPLDLAHAQRADIDRWLAQVDDYAAAPAEASAAANDLQQHVRQLAGELDAAQAPGFAEERERLEGAIERFRRTPFVVRDLREGTFTRRRDYLQAEIAAAAARYRQTPSQWIEQLPALASSSPAANAYWDNWKQSLQKDVASLTSDPAAWRGAKRQADQLRNTLKDLDATFISAAPTNLGDAFNEGARQRREKAMADALGLLDPQSPRVDLAALKAVDESYDEWVRDLRDLMLQFPIRKRLLTLDDRPDVNWRTTAIWKEPAVQAAVKKDLARIEALQELTHQSIDQLVQTALEAKEPEVVWAAWRQVAQPLQLAETNWPTHAGELEKEARIRARLGELLKTVDAEDAALPLAEMKRLAPEQWRRFAERATTEEMLASALALQTAFDATPETFDRLPAHVRFNLLLYTARQQTGDDAAAPAVAALARQLAKAGAAVDPKPDDLLSRLARYEAPEPFAQLQPKDVFTLPVAAMRTPLVFRRVQPIGGRAFYLQTTEISLGQVIDAFESAQAWEQALRLPWGAQGSGGETRPGLRGWEWTDRPPRLSAALSWGSDADFPAEFRPEGMRFNRRALDARFGGNPSDAHPMQQISAQGALFTAALLGCRLPTTDEWRAANAEQPRPAAPPNLRDATWERERRHLIASGVTPARWPDRAIFALPENSADSPASRAPADDGALLFRPIPSGTADGEVKFFDLVGNVAEFVCNASESFENWPEGSKRTADGVRQFAIRAGGSIRVIGGSALAPPLAPVDRAQAVPRTNEGYADVGFRLAFSAPSRSPAQKLAWALADQDYLWPRPAPQANAAKQ